MGEDCKKNENKSAAFIETLEAEKEVAYLHSFRVLTTAVQGRKDG